MPYSLGRQVLTQIEKIRIQILEVMRRCPKRPMYLGEIASGIDWSLERTETYLSTVELKKFVRLATSAEKASIDACADANVWMLR